MISIRSASDVPWADVERVFSTPGDPRTCWCRYFKLTGAQWTATDVAARAAALREDTRRADPTPGLVAFVDDEPAGWVAVEPRVNLPRLFRSRVVAAGMSVPFDDASVWSIVCFVVRREFRGQGLARELVRAAVDHARSSGATTVEAYPIDPALVKGSHAGSLYHGTVSMFRAAGFDEITVAAPARRVMTLAV
jgi:GNAT superfamily N-acetyltransferase